MLVSEQPKTLHQIARAMGKSSAAIYRPVHRMVDAGILIPTDRPPTRGTQFRLDPVVLGQLGADVDYAGGPGLLISGQKVLLVSAPTVTALYEVMARPKMAATISWCTTLDGGKRRLLALDREATQFQLDRLVKAFEANGVSAEPVQIGELMTGEHARGAAEEIVRDGPLVHN